MISLGEVAYNAYCEQRQWKSYYGDKLPKFKDQLLSLQHAWNVAAHAVIKEHLRIIIEYMKTIEEKSKK